MVGPAAAGAGVLVVVGGGGGGAALLDRDGIASVMTPLLLRVEAPGGTQMVVVVQIVSMTISVVIEKTMSWRLLRGMAATRAAKAERATMMLNIMVSNERNAEWQLKESVVTLVGQG